MLAYEIYYSGCSSLKAVDDIIIAESPIAAAKRFIIDNKGQLYVHFVKPYNANQYQRLPMPKFFSSKVTGETFGIDIT